MMVIIAAVGVLLALSVGIALAGAYDITTAGAEVDINGAIFRSFLVDDPTGTGYFDPFLRVNANTDIVQGYNTDYRPLEFDEDASWTESLPLSCLPTVSEEGVLYREVQLDINETKPQSILSLEEVEIYLTADSNLYPYPFDPASVTLVYDLDAGAENWVLLDYANNKGSGKRDMKLLVPDAFFGAYDPTCAYAGNAPACETTGCGEYVVLYSLFGGHETKATDGFEEWGVPVIDTPLGKIIVDKVTDPTGSPQEFDFVPDYTDPFTLTDEAAVNDSGWLLPDTYSVSETVPDGWDLTSSSCDDGSDPSAIGLDAGEVVTCIFTDTQRGKIIVDKVTVPGGSDQEFDFVPDYTDPFTLTDAADPNDSGWLLPDTYSVSETVPGGWDLTDSYCDDGSPVNAIVLDPGETVICTFEDTKLGKIKATRSPIPLAIPRSLPSRPVGMTRLASPTPTLSTRAARSTLTPTPCQRQCLTAGTSPTPTATTVAL